jgi:flagellar protein FlbD
VIRLTRLSGYELYLNADLICSVEAHPDTVVTLVDGKHYVVTESADIVVDAVTRYRASVLALADSFAGAYEESATDAESSGPAGSTGSGGTASAATGQLYVLHGERD